MYRFKEDFLEDWKEETSLTLKIFQSISEDKKSKKLDENVRSLERLGWHLTQTLTEMPFRAGLFDKDDLEHKHIPGSFQEIINDYQKYSHEVQNAVEQKWTDSSLKEVINMYGEDWSKSKILSILIRHQIHHRGQMTTLMRLLNLEVPGLYGPSKEEWIRHGMVPME